MVLIKRIKPYVDEFIGKVQVCMYVCVYVCVCVCVCEVCVCERERERGTDNISYTFYATQLLLTYQ